MDLYSRRIVGWAFGKQATKELVIQALEADRPDRRIGPIGAVLSKTCRSIQDVPFYPRRAALPKTMGVKHRKPLPGLIFHSD